MSIDLAALYRRTVESWNDRVREVGPEQWDAPTPCSDWTVRELVNHVTGEDLWTAPLVQGSTIEDVGDQFDGDVLGDDPTAAALAAAGTALDAVAARLPTGGTVQLSYGEEQLDEYVRQLAADHLVHGWDLATAVGGDARLDDDLVEGVAEWFADREEIYRTVGAVGPRAGTFEDPQDDLIARFGRDPHWQG
jgi:uncharacterized protein (TIGR03086 family)